MEDFSNPEQARDFLDIRRVVQFTEPITTADHPWYTDFRKVRGSYNENRLLLDLGVDPFTKTFAPSSAIGKPLIFLAGLPGSGKTTELARLGQQLAGPKGFFVITCNIDKGLDMNKVEYMDILIYQLEMLLAKAKEYKLKVNDEVVESMRGWFEERVEEVNKSLKDHVSLEVGAEGSVGIPGIFKLFTKLRTGVHDSNEHAQKVRLVLKEKFSLMAEKCNEFLAYVNQALQAQGIAREVLFIVDGLEKVLNSQDSYQVVIEESNRLHAIKAYTLFTFPLGLLAHEQKLSQFHFFSFPFVKLQEQNGSWVEAAIAQFEAFVYKRIAPELFDDPETVREAIRHSGGSPRELLRILKEALYESIDQGQRIERAALERALDGLAIQRSRRLSEEDLNVLKALDECNRHGKSLPFSPEVVKLMEETIVMEYNQGNYKRVSPVVGRSKLYQQHVG